MRLPKVRFTVRRMMVVVAGVAVVLGVGLWAVRESRLRRLRTAYVLTAWECRYVIKEELPWAAQYMGRNELSVVGRWYATRARKYERAARCPWLPVDPDPRWSPEVRDFIGLLQIRPHAHF